MRQRPEYYPKIVPQTAGPMEMDAACLYHSGLHRTVGIRPGSQADVETK